MQPRTKVGNGNGAQDAGELLVDAAAREVVEEVGIKVLFAVRQWT